MYRNLVRSIRLWLLPAALWVASVSPAAAQEVFGGWAGACGVECGIGCQTHHCPPPLQHCQERPPIIRVKCGCPKPICNPCTQPNWGYYETCWSPWPWPPDYNHCSKLPPAATIALSGPNNPQYPNYGPNGGPNTVPNAGQYPTNRQPPLAVEPSMPPVSSPPIPTTPGMPRMSTTPMPQQPTPQQPMPPQNPMPNVQPMPGGGIDALPVPRPENPRPELPPRPLPNPGGF